MGGWFVGDTQGSASRQVPGIVSGPGSEPGPSCPGRSPIPQAEPWPAAQRLAPVLPPELGESPIPCAVGQGCAQGGGAPLGLGCWGGLGRSQTPPPPEPHHPIPVQTGSRSCAWSCLTTPRSCRMSCRCGGEMSSRSSAR